ncbi:MAG: molecular chaperone DnaK [Burkholderiales bacterium PBB5]|nr:MAG: molecular chaperone DnaK [Burkholderiales bacterium PBB5]
MTHSLTTAQLASQRGLLQALQAQLAGQQQAHLGGHSRAEHARELLQQDANDAAQHDAERELDLARTDRDAVALADVEAALQRLAQGSYGLCGDCGDPIAAARLALAPTARRCVACESQHERGTPRPATL